MIQKAEKIIANQESLLNMLRDEGKADINSVKDFIHELCEKSDQELSVIYDEIRQSDDEESLSKQFAIFVIRTDRTPSAEEFYAEKLREGVNTMFEYAEKSGFLI